MVDLIEMGAVHPQDIVKNLRSAIAQTKPLSDHLSQPLPNTLYVDETGKTSVFDGKQWKPLYQTKSLTDDELQKMWKGNVESCGWDSVIDFARAIEERHGIK